ncbi:Penicillin-binding protein activator LpoB precursor [Candidatus Arsenophonus lipoptenae]|uniref:Penicillin-binding protein activator LpoB n=1 Tax=Candidatus Arsenophonus lipoptenae TaxID=634113 RepID=A0A0X9VDN5_9GAMM|nr:hypothetical protein [Candidatus Arsenophonus lipoptenae]AMA64674.1 Penicillin-binding protein activator LpoB precursor [Candidatus Arsenophonus lipoptenae]
MRCIVQVIIISYMLISCSLITKKQLIPITKTVNRENKAIMSMPETVPKIPELKTIDWIKVLIPLSNQLIKSQIVQSNKVLLIDSIQNNTNTSIQSMKIIDAIIEIFNKKNIFKLVPQNMVANARQSLGLSQEDNLIMRSKIIGLARYMHADYVLYLIISDNKKYKEIKMQLIETQTGEIFWSGINKIE